MGKRDLARADLAPAANEAGVRGGVVGRAEGTLLQERRIARELATHYQLVLMTVTTTPSGHANV